jgi:hypothetical protein
VCNPQEVLEELVFWENTHWNGFKCSFYPLKLPKSSYFFIEKLAFLDFSQFIG